MASSDKTFYYYFKENMNDIIPGVEVPETVFGKLTTAVANIGLMADYVSKNHGVKVGEMLKNIPISTAGASGGAAVGTAGVISKTALGIAELIASFFVGACLGSLTVASLRCYSDFATKATAGNKSFNEPEFYSVADISRCAKNYQIAMDYAVQKTLHRNRVLCKNHLKSSQ